MVIPTREAPKPYLRWSGKSSLTLILGSCLITLSFFAGIFYNEVSHYDAPSSISNLRRATSLNAPVLSSNDEPCRPDKVLIKEQDLFVPESARRNIKSKWGKPIQRPDDWKTWNFHDVHSQFECSKHAHDQNKPLPDMEYWEFYRDTFKRVVDPSIVFDDPIPPTDGYTMDENGKQPYYAKRSPGKGRGLFASRDIKKGEVVHDGNKSDIEMSADEWRSTAFSLPQKMACDFSEWTWTQQSEKGGRYKILTAFNISILMNGSKHPNAMPKDSYSSKFFATRDIKKDEEILTDYKIYPTKWTKVGL